MNEARKKVEEFKKNANHDQLRGIAWSIKVEKTNNMGYHEYHRAFSIAKDNKIAEMLGVTLDDHETWPDESAVIESKNWVASLPDA